MQESELAELDKIVRHQPPMQPGQHLYHPGETSRSLYAVRSGALKNYCITESGDEQVLGFTLPGELIGLDGLADGSYSSASVTLDTTSVCEMPFDSLESLCARLPGLNRQLLRVASKEISADHQLLIQLGKRSAEERLASFRAANGRPDNLIDRLLAGPSDTRAIAKSVCASVLGSAATLVQ